MLSLVVYFNRNNHKANQKFLSHMSVILSNLIDDIEIIFIVQDDSFDLVNKICELESLSLRTKIIFCTKVFSFNQQLNYLIKQVNTKYVWILNHDTKYLIDDFLNVLKVVKEKDIDLIEMKFKLSGNIKWNPKERIIIEPLTEIDVVKEKKIIAYTFPFVFNKVFSKKQMLKVLNSNLLSIYKDSSSILSTEFLYVFMLNIKSYVWLPNNIVNINIHESDIPNYTYAISEWENICSIYRINDRYLSEIKYAKVYYLQIILTSFYGNSKSKISFNHNNKIKNWLIKYHDKLLKIKKDELQNFDIDNKYMLNKNNENILLRTIQPVNKWNKIFSLLEK